MKKIVRADLIVDMDGLMADGRWFEQGQELQMESRALCVISLLGRNRLTKYSQPRLML